MFHDWKKQSVKYLLALTLPIVPFLPSCAPAKRTVQADSRTVQENSACTSVAAHITEQGVTAALSDIAQREIVETVITEYDTEKPVDPATGLPPVLRTQKQTRRQDTNVQSTQTETRQTETGIIAQSRQEEETDVTRAVLSEQRRGLTWWQKALCWAGVAGLLFLSVRVYFRVFKR